MATLEQLNTITATLAVISLALGLFGLVATTFCIIARTRARATAARGTITVRASFPQGSASELRMQVVIKDPMGDVVAKGTISSDATYETALAAGLYKVFVNAPGHCEYMEIIKVAAEQTCAVTAYLNAISAPVLNMSR